MDNQSVKKMFLDPSLLFLFLSNLVIISLFSREGWNLLVVMWIYWFQSVTIGVFNFIRILRLKDFSVDGFAINNHHVQATNFVKIFTALFFLFHYGTFHIVYLIFLLVGSFSDLYGSALSGIDMKYIFLSAFIFFLNHLFSFVYNDPRDTKKQNIGTLMFFPYFRIIPMHLAIIFGVFYSGSLTLFLGLKAFTDCLMHIVNHSIIRRGE